LAKKDRDDVDIYPIREPSRERTFKVVVVVVVGLLLINLFIVVYFVHPAFNDDDDEGEVNPPPPRGEWIIAAEPENITEDTTWTGIDGFLERPLLVKSGVTLVMVDCHIRVHLQDLVLWLIPAIEVEPGGQLQLVNSVLEVHQDPRLAASVFGPTYADNHIPSISRVVNLVEAENPVLNFDVSWWGNGTPLAVGVLPSVGAGLEILEVLDTYTSERNGWTHFEVELGDYVGTTPWVVIFFSTFPGCSGFIGNVTVLDGEGPPDGDWFLTGHPLKDGWANIRMYDLDYVASTLSMNTNYLYAINGAWRALIESAGDVHISGSRLVAPDGLARKMDRGIYKEVADPQGTKTIDQVGSRGGHVHVQNAMLSIVDSEFLNVPLTGNGTVLDVSLTTFRGEHDLVSLQRPSGSIDSCDLHSEATPTWREASRYPRYLWGIGVEGASPDGHLSITDCTIEGAQMGLDLTRADVRMEGCTFRRISGMALWDHASTGLGEWEQVSSGNTFESIGTFRYLKSTALEVEFVHPQLEPENITVYSGTSMNLDIDLHGPLVGDLRSFHMNVGRYIVPQVLVTRSGMVQVTREVTTVIGWQQQEGSFRVPLSQDHHTVDLQVMFQDDDPEEKLGAPMVVTGIEPTAWPYTYEFRVLITDTEGLNVLDPTMRFVLDGQLEAEVVLTSEMYTTDWRLLVHNNLTLTAGWHDLNVSVHGRKWLGGDNFTEEPVHLETLVSPVLVLDGVTEVEPWMPFEARFVLIQEGASAVLDPFEPRSPGNDPTVHIVGWPGSSVRLVGGEGLIPKNLRLMVDSNVSLELVNTTIRVMEIKESTLTHWSHITSAPVRITNLSCDSLFMRGWGRNITLVDLLVREYLMVTTANDSNVLLEHSTFEDASVWIEMQNGTFVMRNCSVSTIGAEEFFITPGGPVQVTVLDSTFDGISLMVFLRGFGWEAPIDLRVTRCTFSGDDAILYVGMDLINVDFYDEDPDHVPPMTGRIWDNTFSGPDNGVVLNHGLFERLYEDGNLQDGARLFAFYVTRLQVIPPDGTPFWGAYTFEAREDIVPDWPYDIVRWIELDGELLYDVTDDTGKEADPPILDVLLYSKWGSSRIVRGFGSVDPDADNDEATYPVMPDFYEVLKYVVVDWPPHTD
jgi:hypothetical protein